MRRKNISRTLWGVGFIAAGIFLLLDQMHVINFNLSFWTIVWTVVFVAMGISSIADKSISGTVFAIAFLAIVYAKPLHISHLVPWTILIVALLISIGLDMIFKKNNVHGEVFVNGEKVNDIKSEHILTDVDKVETDDDIIIDQKISDTSRYIRSQNLRSVTINSFIGDAELHFDQAKAAGESVVMDINASIGDIDIYVPNDWQVVNELNSSWGDIDYFGHSNGTGTKLILRGSKKIGDLEIHFV